MLIVVKQKQIIAVLLLLVLLQLSVSAFLCVRLLEDESTSIVDFTVVIDAGHGGIDGGVTANGIRESDLNLDYAKALGEYFSRSGFNVVYTRKTKDGLYGVAGKGFKLCDMQKRKEIICAAQPNLVISVHMNKFSQNSRSGPQVFFQHDSQQGKKLAESVQKAFNNFTGNSHNAIGGDFYVCRESPCTAVIVECGFISNLEDAARLKTQAYRQEICRRIFDGVMLYLYEA